VLEIHHFRVVVAPLVAFVMTSVCYPAFGKARMELLDQNRGTRPT
jgi:hypothetical protein